MTVLPWFGTNTRRTTARGAWVNYLNISLKFSRETWLIRWVLNNPPPCRAGIHFNFHFYWFSHSAASMRISSRRGELAARSIHNHHSVFFLPNDLCVHVRKLGTSVRKSTTTNYLQNLPNWYQCRSELTSRSFVIQRRDIWERSYGFCLVASLVHACDRYRRMGFWRF